MAKKDHWTNYYGVAWNPGWKIRGRQLMLWVSHSSSGYFNMSPGRQYDILDADTIEDIYGGKSWILTLGLFDRTEKEGVFKRHILPGETTLQYFHRALQKVDLKFALVWKLDRLLFKNGCAEHTNREFAEALGKDISWISRYLKELVAEGIVKRYGGNKGRGPKMYYCNPHDKYLNADLLKRYGAHEEDNVRCDSYELKALARAAAQTQDRTIERRLDKRNADAEPVVIKRSKKDNSVIE
jgi:DNA-binding MarR family transcriptional regulator